MSDDETLEDRAEAIVKGILFPSDQEDAVEAIVELAEEVREDALEDAAEKTKEIADRYGEDRGTPAYEAWRAIRDLKEADDGS